MYENLLQVLVYKTIMTGMCTNNKKKIKDDADYKNYIKET